jgi:hypothetical protein
MNMKRRTTALTAGLLVAVPLSLAPSASADMRDVRQNIAGADAALERAAELAAGNQSAATAIALAKANKKARVANRHAKSLESERKASRANRMVGMQFGENANAGLDLLDEVRPVTQDDVAELVAKAMAGRDRAVAVLTDLLDQVPAQAQPAIAKAIAAIGLEGGDQADEIGELLESGEVSADAVAILEVVTTRLEEVMARIEGVLAGVLDQLPPEARTQVEAALAQVTDVLEGILSDLEGIFDGLPIGGLPIGGLPIPPLGGGG